MRPESPEVRSPPRSSENRGRRAAEARPLSAAATYACPCRRNAARESPEMRSRAGRTPCPRGRREGLSPAIPSREEIAGLVEREGRRVRRLRPVERRAFAVGRDLADDALLARAGVRCVPSRSTASPRCISRPDRRMGRCSVSIDFVDSALGRRRHVEPTVGCRRERVPLELVAVEEHRAFPCESTRTSPSLPEPTNSDPSGPAATARSEGDDVSPQARWQARARAGRGCRSTGSRRRP